MTGAVTFACGHTLTLGYGPVRSSDEDCRDCLRERDELGAGARRDVPIVFALDQTVPAIRRARKRARQRERGVTCL